MDQINKERIEFLLERYTSKAASNEEVQELTLLLQEGQHDEQIRNFLERMAVKNESSLNYTPEQLNAMVDSLLKREQPKVRRMWVRWAAAASVVLVTSYGLWVMSERKATRQQGSEATEVAKGNDVPAPSGTRAMITLADGSTIYLDSVAGGTLAVQNDVQVMKTAEGKVVYTGVTTKGEMVYNTLFNPRGSKVVDMQLSDGSHVWLNAGSSMKYPVAFVGNERKVEITGEAYFEVAHDANKPFVVSKDDVSVTVLGTHFNVNAYDDEDAVRVTLIEGSVKVARKKEVLIKPGEQAVVNDQIKVSKDVDIDGVMAWKNGTFDFDNADLQTIMKQIARWYDVDVVYQGDVPKEPFKGEISRNVPASKVLQMLEYLGVHFKIEGKTVTVLK
jgi:transmembrane sensor